MIIHKDSLARFRGDSELWGVLWALTWKAGGEIGGMDARSDHWRNARHRLRDGAGVLARRAPGDGVWARSMVRVGCRGCLATWDGFWGLAFTGFPYTIALRTGNPAAGGPDRLARHRRRLQSRHLPARRPPIPRTRRLGRRRPSPRPRRRREHHYVRAGLFSPARPPRLGTALLGNADPAASQQAPSTTKS